MKAGGSGGSGGSAGSMGFGAFTRRFVLPLWPWYLSGTVLLAAINIINLEIPQLAKEIINKLVSNDALTDQSRVALTIVGLGFVTILIRTLSRILIFWPGRQVEMRTKSYLFSRAVRLGERFFNDYGIGDLISRLANDVSQLRAFYAFGVLQVLNVLFLTVFTLAKMSAIHLTLTVLLLIPLVLTFVITRYAMPKIHAYSRANQDAVGSLTNRVTEAFVNVHVIQSNAAQAAFCQRAAQQNEDVFKTSMQLVYIRTFIWPLMSCLAGVSQLVVLLYGGHEVMVGRLSVGDILAFNVYIGLLTFPLTALGIILSLLQRARTALARIGAIDQATPEAEPSDTVEISVLPGPLPSPEIEVRQLNFSYPGSASVALKDLSFQVAKGQRLGIFGRIGSGKSTLFQVLTRLYDPPPGTVYYRGHDILDLAPGVVRREIGYALQQAHLFSATIKANLTMGLSPEPGIEALRTAARAAQILGEIEAWPAGWDTEIGERGIRLSGGQKQRLALARMLLRQPPVMLLDDVLSAVDQATERRLIDQIFALGTTMLIASHRTSALMRCDQILILDDGRITAQGSFDALVKTHPELLSTK